MTTDIFGTRFDTVTGSITVVISVLNLLIACHWHYHLQLLQLLDPCDIEPDLV
jgi:hypothetical protein